MFFAVLLDIDTDDDFAKWDFFSILFFTFYCSYV